ncbi:MAG TPA: hypothetical protein VMZ53_20210 [Kofleriaceae bacterium]|nr:hypothetical protein [Kofleriaceae bacterium]
MRTLGLCTVQDLGRRGHMHEAVPPGGALVPELLVAANRRVGNRDDAPALEVLGRLVVRAASDVHIATHRESCELRPGGEHVVESAPLRAAYLAVRGGFDVPVRLGGRGTLLCARLGRPLARGDVLRVGTEARGVGGVGDHGTSRESDRFVGSDDVAVIPGPDLDAFESDAIEELVRATYRISPTSDRVGTRLEDLGAPSAGSRASSRNSSGLRCVEGYRERSRPMVIGALEVPRDGQPIVLGPEHPTTGGYPVIAVIASAELGRFFAIPLGGTVRFRVAR